MTSRTLVLLALCAAAGPAHATMAIIPFSTPVPGLGLFGVAATGVAALVIAWWRMRK
jgi:hypothetical protein